VATVCGGVFLITGGPALWRLLSRTNTSNEHDSAQARARLLAGLRWGALTGLLIAGYTVVDGYAVKVLLVGPVLLDYVSNLLRLPFLMSASLHQRSAFKAALRSQWRAALVVAVISPAGYVLVLYALKIAPLSQVIVQRVSRARSASPWAWPRSPRVEFFYGLITTEKNIWQQPLYSFTKSVLRPACRCTRWLFSTKA
jgi:hypothetical protein